MSFIKKYSPQYLKNTVYNKDFIDFINALIDIDSLNIVLIGLQGYGKSLIIKCILNKYYGLNTKITNQVMFIDNLKEEGITFFRNEIKNFCQMSSSILNRKKTIVIDDIDILHDKNQQILRSLIDTYSHNVNFICSSSTTNKIINNLQSRLNIINVPNITSKELGCILNQVCLNENIHITESAKRFLINICDNSINLLYTNLEKISLYISSYKKDEMTVDCNMVNTVCSKMCLNNFYNFTKEWFVNKNVKEAYSLISSIYLNGYSLMDIYENYFNYVKLTTLLDERKKMIILPMLCKYITCAQETDDSCVELYIFTNELIHHIYEE